MIKIDADSVINLLLDTLLPRGSGESKGIHFEIDASFINPVSYKEKRKFIHFIIQRPYNYTKVFSLVTDKPLPFHLLKEKVNDFEFLGYYDSCYRDFIRQKLIEVYFQLTKDKEIAPIKFEDRSSFSCFSPNYVMVEIVRDDSPDAKFMSGYKKKLKYFERWVEKK